jgi:glutathione transport system permease protein
MVAYLLRRLLLGVSIVWAISFGAFVSFGLSFDPTYPLILGGRNNPQRLALIAEYHLHDPILERYWLWLTGLFRHGFGTTVLGPRGYGAGVEIGPAVWSAASVTAQLIATSLVLVVVGSIVVGVIGARWPRTALDVGLRLLAYAAWSMPAFLVGVLLVRWLLLPHGWFFGGRPGGGVVHWARTMTLPAITLSLGFIGVYSRYIRSAMLVSLRQPYAVVARAKGLSERQVILRHALRNSLIPFVSVLSLEFAAIVGASIATDYVFGMGGLASLFLGSLRQADPFAMTAILVLIGGTVAAFMLVADLALGSLDPRLAR